MPSSKKLAVFQGILPDRKHLRTHQIRTTAKSSDGFDTVPSQGMKTVVVCWKNIQKQCTFTPQLGQQLYVG